MFWGLHLCALRHISAHGPADGCKDAFQLIHRHWNGIADLPETTASVSEICQVWACVWQKQNTCTLCSLIQFNLRLVDFMTQMPSIEKTPRSGKRSSRNELRRFNSACTAEATHLLLKEIKMLLAFCGAYRLPMSRCSSAPLLWPTPCTGSPTGARFARGPARSLANVVTNFCGAARLYS